MGDTRQVVPTVAVGHRRGILAGQTCVLLAALRLSGLPHRRRPRSLRKDNFAVVHFLGNALREATDTVRYDTFACILVLELAEHGGALRADARQLAAAIGLAS